MVESEDQEIGIFMYFSTPYDNTVPKQGSVLQPSAKTLTFNPVFTMDSGNPLQLFMCCCACASHLKLLSSDNHEVTVGEKKGQGDLTVQ